MSRPLLDTAEIIHDLQSHASRGWQVDTIAADAGYSGGVRIHYRRLAAQPERSLVHDLTEVLRASTAHLRSSRLAVLRD